MKDKAVRFLSNVVGDPDKAGEFEQMGLEEYAQHKGIEIKNPRTARLKGKPMARSKTRSELEDRVAELEDENQALNDKLDSILDIASEDADEDEDEDSDDDDDNGQD